MMDLLIDETHVNFDWKYIFEVIKTMDQRESTLALTYFASRMASARLHNPLSFMSEALRFVADFTKSDVSRGTECDRG